MDISDLNIPRLAYQAMHEYQHYRDKKALLKVIEEHPEYIAESKLFRSFVLSFIESGNPKSPYPKTHKETADVAIKAQIAFIFYVNLGYPKQPNEYTKETGLSAAELAGEVVGKSGWTVYRQYHRECNKFIKAKDNIDSTSLFDKSIAMYKGRAMLKFNGGITPDSKAKLKELISNFEALPEEEQHRLIWDND